MTTKEERSKINQALAKAIAYKDCGKPDMCAIHALQLLELLQCKDIIDHMIIGKLHTSKQILKP